MSKVVRLLALTASLWLLACGSDPVERVRDVDGSLGGPGTDSGALSDGGLTDPLGEGGEDPDANTGPELVLPIEVLGSGAPDQPVVAASSLTLAGADTSAVESLYVQCHRCGFYEAPEFEALAKPLVKVKASLRIVGAENLADSATTWIDISNASVQVDAMALAHGGINGGMTTLTFLVTLDTATKARLVASGGNRIEFRFNGTDGHSNGFRILDLQLRDSAGNNLTPMTKRWADIEREKAAGKEVGAASERGQELWSGRNLLAKSSIVPRKIRAACSDCHASDGRDLQYFNYSDNSIIQRSVFHGLSVQQGEDIVAYLRGSLYGDKLPHVAAAAPWNPPFQPGPGLDTKPAVEWTAGAGLDAVLPDGKMFMKALFGKPMDDAPLALTQAEIRAALDANKTLNTRELPVALQFPDWNAWLPPVHPLDIWTPDAGKSAGLFESGYQNHNPLVSYQTVKTWLETNRHSAGAYGDWSHLTPNQRNELQAKLQGLGGELIGFGGGGRGSRISSDPGNPYGVQIGAQKQQTMLAASSAALADLTSCGPVGQCTPFSTDAFIERANVALYHWLGVKQWELVETYGLQAQASFHGSVDAAKQWVGEGEARGWPFSWPSVFLLAPHMLYSPTETANGKRDFYFAWENRLVSYYRTNAWYQLQVTVNPGWAGASNGPVDWPYTQGFITGLADDLKTAKAPPFIQGAHLARYFAINAKLAQKANTDISFNTPSAKEPADIWLNTGLQSKADLLFKLSPATVMDERAGQATRFRVLEQISDGAYLHFVNGSIALYNSLYADTRRSQYRICDPNNTQMGTAEQFAGQRFCIDAGRSALPTDSQGRPYCPYPANNGYTTQQYSAWGVLAARALGADAALVKTWSDWNEQMWP